MVNQEIFDRIDFEKGGGLVPVITADVKTGNVLMLAYMNRESLKRTVETGVACYWSRSRNKFWIKGETSGHYQHVREIVADCDTDTLLMKVEQVGVACHTGAPSCFFNLLYRKDD